MKLCKQPAWWLKTGTTLALALTVASREVPMGTAYTVGGVLAITGATVNLWHYRLFRQVGRLVAPSALRVRGGLLPWVRHPMYLGEGLLMAGLVILAVGATGLPEVGRESPRESWNQCWPLVLGVIGWLATWQLAEIEDAALAKSFPEAHATWRRTSGLLWPTLNRGRRETANSILDQSSPAP